jgi:transmembrane sensor
VDDNKLRELLNKFATGQCSPQELAELEAWYAGLGQKLPEGQHDQAATDALRDRMWRNILAQTGLEMPKVIPLPKPRFPLRQSMQVAAALMVLFVIGYAFVQSREPLALVKPNAISYTVKAAPKGKRMKLTLPDGSLVWLNANSRLRYADTYRQGRDVDLLEGEAFFEVRRDTLHPFRVRTGAIWVTVLGTSFNVKAYPGAPTVAVTVATGQVAVADSIQRLALLSPNQQLAYHKTSGQYVVGQADGGGAARWRTGQTVFDQATFAEVAAVLGNRFDIDIEIDQNALKNCRVTATFDDTQPLKEILYTLAKLHQARFVHQKGKVRLTGKGCP